MNFALFSKTEILPLYKIFFSIKYSLSIKIFLSIKYSFSIKIFFKKYGCAPHIFAGSGIDLFSIFKKAVYIYRNNWYNFRTTCHDVAERRSLRRLLLLTNLGYPCILKGSFYKKSIEQGKNMKCINYNITIIL